MLQAMNELLENELNKSIQILIIGNNSRSQVKSLIYYFHAVSEVMEYLFLKKQSQVEITHKVITLARV